MADRTRADDVLRLDTAADAVLAHPLRSGQGRAMRDEIEAVLRRCRDLGEGEPDAERLLVATIVVPVEPRARAGER